MSPMGKTLLPSSEKEAQVPMAHAEPEVEMQVEEGALVPVEGAAAVVEITVRIPKARLDCPVCTLPLKPPIFQCAFGHMACGLCRDHLPVNDRCYVCGHAGGYWCSTAVEDVVRSAKILCPLDAYGCRSYMTYYDATEHQRVCPHAPCHCSEPGCGGFAGSPSALHDHLRDDHLREVSAEEAPSLVVLRRMLHGAATTRSSSQWQ